MKSATQWLHLHVICMVAAPVSKSPCSAACTRPAWLVWPIIKTRPIIDIRCQALYYLWSYAVGDLAQHLGLPFSFKEKWIIECFRASMQLLLSCLSKKRSYIMTIWLVEWHKMYRDSGIESITLVYNIAGYWKLLHEVVLFIQSILQIFNV